MPNPNTISGSKGSRKNPVPSGPHIATESPTLLKELRGLIDAARQQVAQTANAALTMLYWHVGQRIRRKVLQDGRAEYGEQILPTLSAKLVEDSGQGFSTRNLARMIRFAEVLPNETIVAALSQQLIDSA